MRPRIERLLAQFCKTTDRVTASGEGLCRLVDSILQDLGFAAEEINSIDRLLADRRKSEASAAMALGAGFTAWMMAQTGPMLEKAAEEALSIAKFFEDNVDVLTAGWVEALPVVAKKLVAMQLHLSDTVVDLTDIAAKLATHADQFSEAAQLVLDHGMDVGSALEIAGVAGDVLDAADAVTSLGAGLVLSWVVGSVIDARYGPQIEERKQRISALGARRAKLLQVRSSLRVGIPSAVIAGSLDALRESDRSL